MIIYKQATLRWVLVVCNETDPKTNAMIEATLFAHRIAQELLLLLSYACQENFMRKKKDDDIRPMSIAFPACSKVQNVELLITIVWYAALF